MKRINPFADPLKQAEVREFNQVGCGACRRRIFTPGRGYECENKCPGYPDETRHTCGHWRARCWSGHHD